jgi:hypothetical protein
MKKTLITIATTLGAIILVTTVTYAVGGTLTPSGTAGDDTQYSLNDIYNKLTDFTNTYTEDSGTMSVPESVSASFATLSEIYGLLEAEEADLVAGNIADGVTIFGVEGELEGTPSLTWQTPDPELTLCWSAEAYEGDNGCSIGNGWTAEGYGASEYCEYLEADGVTVNATTPQNVWRLPTRAEFSSITDDTTYGPATQVPGFAENSSYRSSTPSAEYTDSAWSWNSNGGDTFSDDRNNNYSVRCVH